MRSVAEETITCHKPIEDFDWDIGDCYGCRGPHRYMRNGVVACPNADCPGCKENAEENRQEHVKMMPPRYERYGPPPSPP